MTWRTPDIIVISHLHLSAERVRVLNEYCISNLTILTLWEIQAKGVRRRNRNGEGACQ